MVVKALEIAQNDDKYKIAIQMSPVTLSLLTACENDNAT